MGLLIPCPSLSYYVLPQGLMMEALRRGVVTRMTAWLPCGSQHVACSHAAAWNVLGAQPPSCWMLLCGRLQEWPSAVPCSPPPDRLTVLCPCWKGSIDCVQIAFHAQHGPFVMSMGYLLPPCASALWHLWCLLLGSLYDACGIRGA